MIQTENLTKKFDSYTALKDISCTIQDGCIYGMVGSNGAGKSTFLRILSGVYKADSGSALLDGEPIYENPAAKGQIVFVPDDLYYINGANMDRMAALYQSLYPGFSRERYKELTKELGLDPGKNINTFPKACAGRRLLSWPWLSLPSIFSLTKPLTAWTPLCAVM